MIGKNGTSEAPESTIPAEARGIRLLAELNPLYRQRVERGAELRERRDALLLESRSVWDRISPTEREIVLTPRVPAPSPPTDYDPAVKAILGDDAPPFVPPQRLLPASPDLRRFREIRDELAAMEKAWPILAAETEKATREEHKKVCDHIRPEYREKVAGPVIEALKALVEAIIAHDNWRYDLRNVNLHTLAPIPIQEFVGSVKDRSSPLRRMLAFAAECGHCEARVPEHWRE
jgi:hypothetical protein